MLLKAEIKGKKLYIEIDLEDPPQLSATGKTCIVASTRGNIETEAEYDGKPLIVGLNAYYFPED